MGAIEVTTYIDAPIGRVFSYVSDVETHPRYAPICEKVTITSEKKIGTGVRFLQVQRHRGRVSHVQSEIVEYEPNSKVVWKNLEPEASILYCFQKEREGTRLIHVVEAKFLDDLLARESSLSDNNEELSNLKRLLEM